MKAPEDFLQKAVADALQLHQSFFSKNLPLIRKFYDLVQSARREKKQVFIFGNGGSAADAQHFAAELMHRVEHNPIGMRAVALHTDTSLLTAIANDEGFASVYSRQIEVHAGQGDLAIAISTSGQSTNIVEALRAARKKGCVTVGLLGRKGGAALEYCDLALIVPHDSTPRIQEVHGMIIHLVCQLLEQS